MSTLGLYSMDCTLRTSPSVTQLDDLMWPGLGDIDCLDSLDQIDSIMPLLPPSLPGSVFETKSPVLSTKEDPAWVTVIPNRSLEADQWEIVNSTQLSSVLKDPFNCESVSSVSVMGNGVLNVDDKLSVDTDVFMEDPLRESVQMLDVLPSNSSGTSTQQQDKAECILDVQETTMSNLLEARNSDVGIPSPTPYLLHDKIGFGLRAVPTSSTAYLCLSGAPQVQASVFQQFDTNVQSPQKLAPPLANSTESKAKQAQASRARRLAASQRRAEGRVRKYPLHKLIRMSSPSNSSCDKLSPRPATLGPAVQGQLSAISKQDFGISGAGQAFHANHLNQQVTYIPMVIHDSQAILVRVPLPYSVLASRPVHPEQKMGLQQLPASNCENQHVASEGTFDQCQPVQQSLENSFVLCNPTSSLDMILLKQLQSFVLKRFLTPLGQKC